jgi:Family of unknown function (DUF5681)
MPPENDNKVGYGKPPKETRFKKGQSGNPRGRPRATEDLKMLVGKVLDEKVVITEKGRSRTISMFEAVIKQLVRRSAQGDYRATRDLLELVQEFEQQARSRKTQENQSAPRPSHVLVLPHNNRDPLDPELLADLMRTKERHYARKQREQERQNPANENAEEAPDEHSSAA